MYLPIGHLPKALKDLLRRILIFRHADHESNELLKSHVALPSTDAHEILVHLLLVIHEAQTCQRSRKLQLVQRVAQVPVEMAKNGFKFLELNRCQICHVAGDHLIFEKGQLFGDRGFDEAEFVGKVIVGVGCKIVFFNVRFLTLLVKESEGFEVSVKGWEIRI